MSTYSDRTTFIFKAGSGEWYNQLDDPRWFKFGESREIEPAGWHMKLQKKLDRQGDNLNRVIVDLSKMCLLMGEDWELLIRLNEQLSNKGIEFVVVANEQISSLAELFRSDKRIPVVNSIEEAT